MDTKKSSGGADREIVNALPGPLDGVLGANTLSSFDLDLTARWWQAT